jgi:colicin import membrane protein
MSEYKIQEYNQTAAALSELRARYSRKYDVSTTAGMTEAKAARAAVRGYRVALEKTRIEIKAPALERTRLIDAEAKRITAELLAIEEAD